MLSDPYLNFRRSHRGGGQQLFCISNDAQTKHNVIYWDLSDSISLLQSFPQELDPCSSRTSCHLLISCTTLLTPVLLENPLRFALLLIIWLCHKQWNEPKTRICRHLKSIYATLRECQLYYAVTHIHIFNKRNGIIVTIRMMDIVRFTERANNILTS